MKKDPIAYAPLSCQPFERLSFRPATEDPVLRGRYTLGYPSHSFNPKVKAFPMQEPARAQYAKCFSGAALGRIHEIHVFTRQGDARNHTNLPATQSGQLRTRFLGCRE